MIAALTILTHGCSDLNSHDGYYKDLDEARRLGALENDWFPAVLPESSTEIYTRYDIDFEASWIRFRFVQEDMRAMTARLTPLGAPEINNVEFTNPGSVGWWPKSLKKAACDTVNAGGSALQVYKYSYKQEYKHYTILVPCYFVIDWDSGLAYYWSSMKSSGEKVSK
jgi:hypothetical protein